MLGMLQAWSRAFCFLLAGACFSSWDTQQAAGKAHTRVFHALHTVQLNIVSMNSFNSKGNYQIRCKPSRKTILLGS